MDRKRSIERKERGREGEREGGSRQSTPVECVSRLRSPLFVKRF